MSIQSEHGKGETISLSARRQNVLIAKIVEEFCPHFTPDAQVLYIGGADEKQAFFVREKFAELNIKFDARGKMPDVIVYDKKRNWLVLVEAVTSHGPIDSKRRNELKNIFGAATVGLIFVTAFPDRKMVARYLSEIAWETEVWMADAPAHLIHFNGERFLGPYESE